MPRRRHRKSQNENSRTPRKVSETTTLVSLTDQLLDNDVKFYQYEPTKPVFLHKDELQEVVDLIVDRTKNLVIADGQLKEYTKRGNILTKINKTIDVLKSQRTQLHRQAKESYANFDDEIGNMIDTLQTSYDGLKKQVNVLQEEERQQKINDLEKQFNQIKDEFLKNDNSEFDYQEATFSFTNWLGDNNTKLRLSNKKAIEDMTQYIATQGKDYQTFLGLIQKDELNKEMMTQVYLDNYTGNAAAAYTVAQNKLLELEKLERLRKQQAEQRQRQEEERMQREQLAQQNGLANSNANVPAENTTAPEKSSSMVGESKVGYVFTLYDPILAKKLKDFMEQQGMQFDFETKPL